MNYGMDNIHELADASSPIRSHMRRPSILGAAKFNRLDSSQTFSRNSTHQVVKLSKQQRFLLEKQ